MMKDQHKINYNYTETKDEETFYGNHMNISDIIDGVHA